MQKDISNGSFRVATTASQQVAIRVGYLVLIGFAILRPLSLMGGDKFTFSGISLLDITGGGVSYFLFLPLIAGSRQFQFDRMAFFILLFSLYAVESICWGSEIRKVAQTILPFVLFFSVRMFIMELNQARALLIALILAYIIPITVSTYNVVLGRSIEMIEFWNQLARHSGAFSGSHVLAYTMLFFSFFYCILHRIYQFKKKLHRLVIYFFLMLSVYCLYQSHTRTALIGFMIFWFICLWGNNKKLFYGAIVLSILGGIVFHGHIVRLVLKKAEYDLNVATSGRISIWAGNIQEFIDFSLPQQLLGRGLGHEHRFAFHNDYIALLMSLGIIGLCLYLILFFSLLWDIYLCKDKKIKYLFGAILISTAAMNFGSNAIVFRIELSQYFWLIMGLFYCIPQFKNGEYGT